MTHGLMAEFRTPDELRYAANQVREAGYRKYDAYTPMPIHGLADAMGLGWTPVPMTVAIGGVVGGLSGFGLCEFMGAVPYMQHVGGRPINSWPAYIPITFEMTVLIASLTAVIGMLVMNGLPRPYHPVFNAPRFSAASDDRFFLCIEARDPLFNADETRDFLLSLSPFEVTEVAD